MSENSGGTKSVALPPGSTFQPLPASEEGVRDVVFVSGQSGCGKSHFARSWASLYMKLWPSRKIYLISGLAEDSTLDALKSIKRVRVETLVSDPIVDIVQAFKDSLVIIDDVENLEKDQLEAVNKIRDSICSLGRHTNISLLCLMHLSTNGKDTRLLLAEMTHTVLFPAACGVAQFRWICERYLGLDKQEIGRLRKAPSRWICIRRKFPSTVITENSARLLVTE